MKNLFDAWLHKMAARQDDEWKQAIKYGYDHFKGKELERFFRFVDDIADERIAGRKKVEKKC